MQLPILEKGSLYAANILNSPYPVPLTDNDDVSYIGDDEVIDLEELSKEIKTIKMQTEDIPNTDGYLASVIHKNLKINRNQATEYKFWHYLTIFKYPDYVAWRWFNNGKVNKERYLGNWQRNALGRLWWWAEFTYNPEVLDNKYANTVKATKNQTFMLNIIDNLLGGNRYLVQALCAEVFPDNEYQASEEEIRQLFVRINASLVTVAVDSLDRSETFHYVKEIFNQIVKQQKTNMLGSKPRNRSIINRIFKRNPN